MGIYITMEYSEFMMKHENKAKALQAIKDIMGKVHYGIDIKAILRAKTFEEAMDEWSYPVDVNDNGDVEGIEFGGEKLGEEILMFKAIAPFVEKGSYINVEFENEHWQWAFNGKILKEKLGKVVYD